MKPTQDIIDELRKESAHGPCPRRVSDLLTEAADRIDHLFASGIHTCHADCQRPMCVLRRERDKALAELAALRARVDELEAALRDACESSDSAGYGMIATTFILDLLARAESATPDHIRDAAKMVSSAKHPDTERTTIGEYEGQDGRRYWWTGNAWLYPGQEVAVVAARKHGGAHD